MDNLRENLAFGCDYLNIKSTDAIYIPKKHKYATTAQQKREAKKRKNKKLQK